MKLKLALIVMATAALGAVGLTNRPTFGTFGTWDADMINVDLVPETGQGVYVAVLDTGLVPYWRDYFPPDRVLTKLGTGFDQPLAITPHPTLPCAHAVRAQGPVQQTTWVGSTGSTHGTHVTSTILGYNYRSNFDTLAGFPLPALFVDGIAPGANVIPVKVLADYQLPALPRCTSPGAIPGVKAVFGTSGMIAAGIDYVTDLAIAGFRPMVINMSLGGPVLAAMEQAALDRAIANGVIVVAAAGNAGEEGMSFPAAYPPVISAGASGWTGEWLVPSTGAPFYRMWWLQFPFAPLVPGSGDVPDPTSAGDVYVTDFSSRALPGQQLDVLAPGSWVRGPFPGAPGYSRLPWHSQGIGDLRGVGTNFFFVGGTSMASPHVAAVAALMLQKNPQLTADAVESIVTATALPIAETDSRTIFDPFIVPGGAWLEMSWDTDCGGVPCDPVGAGLIQADAAVASTPLP